MPINIEAPSGLKGTVRGLTGKDGRFLTDRSVQRSGRIVDHILNACWVETEETGIYVPGPNGKLNWSKVLQGDRVYVLLQIRIAGKGHSEYSFKVQCPNPGCRERFEWEIDLDELPVKMLRDDVREQLAAGNNRFQTICPGTEEVRLVTDGEDIEGEDGIVIRAKRKREIVPGTGRNVTFSLPIGADEERATKLRKQKRGREETNELIDAVLMRVHAVEGIDDPEDASVPARRKHKEQVRAFLEELPLQSLADMISRFDEFDCGVDTTVEIECPECGHRVDTDIPFGTDLFFDNKKRSK